MARSGGAGLQPRPAPGIGGWLLLFCVLLVLWEPLNLALLAARTLPSLPLRGPAAILILLLKLAAAAVGLGAGVALWRMSPQGVPLAKASLVLSSATEIARASTPYFPSNRLPGTDAPLVAALLAYNAAWYLYLVRSRRVRETLGG